VILVIEDDVVTRSLLAGMLGSAGFAVLIASDVEEAQHQFELHDPDGVIVDVNLGLGLNGFDLAAAFRRHNPALAIVFLTHIPNTRFLSRNRVPIPVGAAYLRKDTLFDAVILLDALNAAFRGEVTSEHRHDMQLEQSESALLRTQSAVMHLIELGHTPGEIARMRGTSVRAVRDVIKRSRARSASGEVEGIASRAVSAYPPPNEANIPVAT
jgi:DNA-binding NarL/FixJ family response regulator